MPRPAAARRLCAARELRPCRCRRHRREVAPLRRRRRDRAAPSRRGGRPRATRGPPPIVLAGGSSAASLPQRGLVERQRLRARTRRSRSYVRGLHDCAWSGGVRRADRVRLLHEVAVREPAAAAARRQGATVRAAASRALRLAPGIGAPALSRTRARRRRGRRIGRTVPAGSRRRSPRRSVRPRDSRPGGRSRFRSGNTGSRRSSAGSLVPGGVCGERPVCADRVRGP